ncbi:MAG: DUF4926 domain-containing protein [Ignavibacteriae bacterium]|nr:DUF4926 domain-containing protein [Ignavibacteriota bacterium]
MPAPKPFDVVAILSDYPEKDVRRGMVGTVVDTLPSEHVLVECSNIEGETLVLIALDADDVLVLERITSSTVSTLL